MEAVGATPRKLADGSPVPCQVSRAIATPGMPANPSPPPGAPTIVGVAVAALANPSVMPSAPVPGPIVASKLTVRPEEGTGVRQNAVPAAPPTFGVRISVVPLSAARLLTCQLLPVAHGAGIGVPVAPTLTVTVALPVAPRLSVTVSVAMYEPSAL